MLCNGRAGKSPANSGAAPDRKSEIFLLFPSAPSCFVSRLSWDRFSTCLRRADNHSRIYGGADPAFTASYCGFVNGETLASSGVSGSPNLTSNDTAASPVGAYTIQAALGR